MKKIIFVIFLFACFRTSAQPKETVLKIYTFSEVEKLYQQKSIVIFIYTDWCKICFGMKKNTFKDDVVINLLNDNFYFIKLNAEQKEDIIFSGRTFVYKPSGNKTGINELAKELAAINGKISYPTTTILNSNLEIDLQITDYINSENMSTILRKLLTL